ncbi:hypothetical protein QTP86_016913 [Hemibagrus guttatus]|nr:hypothetical protein QTP86_016913 [Hemibagrus guttatus]
MAVVVNPGLDRSDDTTVVGQISNNSESANREEIHSLSALCSMNNLTLNATKIKELIVDFRKSNSADTPHLHQQMAMELLTHKLQEALDGLKNHEERKLHREEEMEELKHQQKQGLSLGPGFRFVSG